MTKTGEEGKGKEARNEVLRPFLDISTSQSGFLCTIPECINSATEELDVGAGVRKGGPGGPAPSLLPLARAGDSVAGTQLRSHPRRARAPASVLIAPRARCCPRLRVTPPRGPSPLGRVTLPTPGSGPQRLPAPEPSWDKSRPPAQEPRTSGAVSPGPHGVAGRQCQRQLRERCVRL